MSSIGVVLGVPANLNLEIEQMDVKFFSTWELGRRNLHGAARMIHRKAQKEARCKLKKILYGLKQAPRQ